jgi:hypothetical protein
MELNIEKRYRGSDLEKILGPIDFDAYKSSE